MTKNLSTDLTRKHEIFLSIVLVLPEDNINFIEEFKHLEDLVQEEVEDYEIVIIDNHAGNVPVDFMDQMTGSGGFRNVQFYSLLRKVDLEIALWAGVSRALGDCVISLDFKRDDFEIIRDMLKKYADGAETVYAVNTFRPRDSLLYKLGFSVFRRIFKLISNVDLAKDSSNFRLDSRRIVNFLSAQTDPHLMSKTLNSVPGLKVAKCQYTNKLLTTPKRSIFDGLKRAVSMVMGVNRVSLRFASSLCLVACSLNVIYSCYVVAISLIKENIADGWISISLQQSGMFFFISLVLFFLSEHQIHSAKSFSNKSNVFVSREATSSKFSVKDNLNIDSG